MIAWKNMDTLASYQELVAAEKVNLAAAMTGENGAKRVTNYTVPMGAGMDFNYGARPVDDAILAVLSKFAQEHQLTEKFAALYNGEVINTGEKRRVLHHMCRGQLGEAVVADGVDKREFYVGEQNKIAEFVMSELHKVDEVAYIRFASVYRQFTDVAQFLSAITEIVRK